MISETVKLREELLKNIIADVKLGRKRRGLDEGQPPRWIDVLVDEVERLRDEMKQAMNVLKGIKIDYIYDPYPLRPKCEEIMTAWIKKVRQLESMKMEADMDMYWVVSDKETEDYGYGGTPGAALKDYQNSCKERESLEVLGRTA